LDYIKKTYLSNIPGKEYRLTISTTIWNQIKEAGKISLVLFRIMVPVIIVVKVLSELGLVKYIAFAFAPVMKLVGLPGEMGLV